MSEEKSSERSTFTIFVVGALVGAGIALLYAPQSGRETRKLLAKKATQLRDKAEETVENAREFISERKADLVAVVHAAKDVAEPAKQKRT